MTAQEHPAYATCTGCTQVKGVKKDGRMKVHNRFAGGGNWQATVECAGSNRSYAEANGRFWDAHRSGWADLPLKVSATMHDFDGEQHLTMIESHPLPDAKRGFEIYQAEGYSVHLYLTEKGGYANTYTVELRDASDFAIDAETNISDDGHLNGLMLKWLERLADTAKDATSQ